MDATNATAADDGTEADAGRPTVSFARQMDLVADPAVPGRYHVDVSPEWNCPTVPQGGMMAALAARAMSLELARPAVDAGNAGNGGSRGNGGDEAGPGGQTLRTLTTVFAAVVPAGPIVADVAVLRRGRSMSQLMATLRAPDEAAGHTTTGVFGRPRPGFEFTDLTRPDVPGPEGCPSFRDPPPGDIDWEWERPPFAFWDKVEGRPALGHAPWEPYDPTTSDTAAWHRFDDPPMGPDGRLDPLALVALSDLMPGAVSEKIGPGQPYFYPPSADLTVHLLGEARSEWVLAHHRARRASQGYASLETALWDQAGSLVAHATQVMFFVFPNGDGPAPI